MHAWICVTSRLTKWFSSIYYTFTILIWGHPIDLNWEQVPIHMILHDLVLKRDKWGNNNLLPCTHEVKYWTMKLAYNWLVSIVYHILLYLVQVQYLAFMSVIYMQLKKSYVRLVITVPVLIFQVFYMKKKGTSMLYSFFRFSTCLDYANYLIYHYVSFFFVCL